MNLEKQVRLREDWGSSDPMEAGPALRRCVSGRCRLSGPMTFGYRAGEVAREMGYASASGVGQAVKRVEAGSPQLKKSIQRIKQKLTSG